MNVKKTVVAGFIAVSLFASSPVLAAGFKDVGNHWAKSTIEWGASQHIVSGYPDGSFKPNASISEAEFLTMLINSIEGAQKKTDQYWASGYYSLAKKMNYPTAGATKPEARDWSITRQKVAEIVSGADGVNYTGDNAVKYLLAKGLAYGKNPKEINVASYAPGDTLSRAEAVQFIKNAKEKGLKELKERPLEPSDPALIPPLPSVTPTPQIPKTPQTNTNGKVTVVSPSNPGLLLPKDTATEPAIQSFLDSLSYANGKVTGKVPALPSGHLMSLRYKDQSDGKNGVRKNDKDLTKLKVGETFSVPVVGQGGRLIFAIYKDGQGKNNVFIEVPSLKAEWGSKR